MRKLATWTLSFAAGVFLTQYLLPPAALLYVAAGFMAAGVFALRLHEPARFRMVLICTALAASLGYSWAYIAWVSRPAEVLADTGQTNIPMVLCDYPEATDYGAKAVVRLHLEGLHGVKAVYYGDESLLSLAPGAEIRGDVYFKSASHIQDDEVTTFTSRGVFLLAYSDGPVTVEGVQSNSLLTLPVRVGHAMREKIGELFSGDTAGFLTAILTGDKSGLSANAGSDLSEAGLYHILAVSGMHCGFLLSMILLLTGRRRRMTAALAIPVLIFYALLAGASPSVVRACVMLSLLLLAPLFRREGDAPTALSVALVLILLQNPFAAASVSLQLSFGAVAGLLWLTPRMYRFLLGEKLRSRAVRFLAASVSATFGALVFTIPLTAWYFGYVVLVSPISNLLCLWAAGLTFCFGMLAVLLGFVWMPLAALVGMIPHFLSAYILLAAHWLAHLPYHAVYLTNPFLKYWLAYGYLLFVLAWLLGPKARRKYVLAAVLAALSLAAAVKLGALYSTYGTLDIVAENVGQGESVILASGGEFAVLDCGSGNRWVDAGDATADRLSGMGCDRLDYLILTHYDYDHVSGVSALLNRLTVKTLLVPDFEDDSDTRQWVLAEAEKYGTDVEFVTEKETHRLGQSVLTVYPPLGAEQDNERGLTLLCSAGDFDFLDTGDMDMQTEKLLLSAYRLPDIEAMMVGHHGSKYSTSEELLQTVKPEVGIISVGTNDYGHPTDQTMERLTAAGVTVYRTDRQGSIHITVN